MSEQFEADDQDASLKPSESISFGDGLTDEAVIDRKVDRDNEKYNDDDDDDSYSYSYEDSSDNGSLCSYDGEDSLDGDERAQYEKAQVPAGSQGGSWSILSNTTESWDIVSESREPTRKHLEVSLENLELMVKQTMRIESDLTASDMASIYSSVFTTKGVACLACTFQNEKGLKVCQECGERLLVNPFPDLKSLLSATAMRNKTSPQMTEHVTKLSQIIEECGVDEEEEEDAKGFRRNSEELVHVEKAFGFCEGLLKFALPRESICEIEECRERVFELARDFSMKQEQLRESGSYWKTDLFYYLDTRDADSYSARLANLMQEWKAQERVPPFIRVAKLSALPQGSSEADQVKVFMVAAIPFKATEKGTTRISLSSSKRCLPMVSFPLNLVKNLKTITLLQSQAKKLLSEFYSLVEPEALPAATPTIAQLPSIEETVPMALSGQSFHHTDKQVALVFLESLLDARSGEEEISALRDLQTNLHGPFEWEVGHASESTRGVKIHDGHVVQLSLIGQGLTVIPDSIRNLKHLEYLNLEGNRLSSYPDAIRCFEDQATILLAENPVAAREHIKCPLEMQAIKDLENQIGYAIPVISQEEIGKRTLGMVVSGGSVSHLVLYNLGLGSVPASITNLKGLRLLDLDHNNFSEIPDALQEMDGGLNRERLPTVVCLYGNPLPTASMMRCPKEIEAIRDLERSIGKPIPLKQRYDQARELGMKIVFGHVWSLSLYGQGLSHLPPSIRDLHSLRFLDVGNNKFSGKAVRTRRLTPEVYEYYCWGRKSVQGYL